MNPFSKELHPALKFWLLRYILEILPYKTYS